MTTRASYRSQALSEFNRRLMFLEKGQAGDLDPLRRLDVLEAHMREVRTGLRSGQPPEYFRLASIAAHAVAWIADDMERVADGAN